MRLLLFLVCTSVAFPACSVHNDAHTDGNWLPDSGVYGNASFHDLLRDRRSFRAQEQAALDAWLSDRCTDTFAMLSPQHQCSALHRDVPVIAQWQSNSCSLPPFTAARFWRALGQRTLLFVGDSLQVQFYFALRCALERDGANPIAVDNGVFHGVSSHEHVSRADAPGSSLLSLNVRARRFGRKTRGTEIRRAAHADDDRAGAVDLFTSAFLFEKSSSFRLNLSTTPLWLPSAQNSARTVLLVSVGSWFSVGKLHQENIIADSTELFADVMRGVVDRVQRLPGLKTIFRSLSPAGSSCSQTSDVRSFGWDLFSARDDIVRSLVAERGGAAAGLFFLDVSAMSRQRPDAHPGAFSARDCLHWCYSPSGVLDNWARLLTMALETA
jgi:hypothetical protein